MKEAKFIPKEIKEIENNNNYIFLDFDGVINNMKTLIFDKEHVDKHNALVLKKLIERTNARIVTTSSVRPKSKAFFKEHKYLIQLKKYNIEVYDTLFDSRNENWELMVKDYINRDKVKNYCIIDDEQMRFKNSKELQDHLVVPVLYQGLRLEHIQPVIDILDGKLGVYPSYVDFNETGSDLCLRANKYHKYLIKKIDEK